MSPIPSPSPIPPPSSPSSLNNTNPLASTNIATTTGGDNSNESILTNNSKKEKYVRYLFKRPRTFAVNEHRHENWMELFIDLFYVAFFVKLGVIIHTCGSGKDIMIFIATVFTGVYMCKFDFDQYMNKFTSDDFVHKIFFAVYLLGLSLMVLDVNESSKYSEDDDHGSKSDYRFLRFLASSSAGKVPQYCPEVYSYIIGFTSGWIITRVSILTLYIVISIYIKPQGRYLLESKAPILLISVSIMIINYFIPSTEKYFHTYIIMVATLVELFGWMFWEVLIYGSWLIQTKGPSALIPTNIHHYAARTGTFVMLVLGEAVLALLTPTLLSSTRVYVFTLLGILMIFILALLYFDAQPAENSAHALGISRTQGIIWIALHPILSFTLFGVGVTLKLMYEDIVEDEYHSLNKLSMGIYLGLSLLTLALIRATHKSKIAWNQLLTISVRCIVAILHIIIGVIFSRKKTLISRDETSIVIHIVLLLIPTLLDAWKYRHFETMLETAASVITRTPSAEGRIGAGFSYTPAIRNAPVPARPSRSASTNDMYNIAPPGSATLAVQSLKGEKPTAVIKHIRRGSSAPKYEPVEGIKSPIARTNSSTSAYPKPRPIQRRKSSDELEFRSYPNKPNYQTEIFRTPIQPSLSVITDKSDLGDVELINHNNKQDESKQQQQHHHQHQQQGQDQYEQQQEEQQKQYNGENSIRTRIFEYDENNELVEVTDSNDISNDDNLYDEEYIDVVYEDDDDNYIEEVQIFETAPVEIASHITWM